MMATRCLLQFGQVSWCLLPCGGVSGRCEARRPTGPLPRRCPQCRPQGRARRPPSSSTRPEDDDFRTTCGPSARRQLHSLRFRRRRDVSRQPHGLGHGPQAVPASRATPGSRAWAAGVSQSCCERQQAGRRGWRRGSQGPRREDGQALAFGHPGRELVAAGGQFLDPAH
jgi:hypothetical protein